MRDPVARARRELNEIEKLARETPRLKVLHLLSTSMTFVRELSRLKQGVDGWTGSCSTWRPKEWVIAESNSQRGLNGQLEPIPGAKDA
jgi:hypothetical protein